MSRFVLLSGVVACLIGLAPASASAQSPGRLDWSWNPITFRGGVPVGGRVHLTLRQDGSYTFQGHFRNSGFPSYSVAVVYIVRDADGRVYTFTNKGRMAGTVERGSRNFDWAINGYNSDIARNWGRIVAGGRGSGHARTSLDLRPLIRDIRAGIGFAREVITVVGPILRLK
jgi:hypothetical protein